MPQTCWWWEKIYNFCIKGSWLFWWVSVGIINRS
jgi:hypothetical protein